MVREAGRSSCATEDLEECLELGKGIVSQSHERETSSVRDADVNLEQTRLEEARDRKKPWRKVETVLE